jgi:hypothetical protein
VELKNAMLRF